MIVRVGQIPGYPPGGLRARNRATAVVRLLPTPAVLTENASTVDGLQFVTASVTPAANRPVYIGIAHVGTTATLPSSVTGCGLTWNLVQSAPFLGSGIRRLNVYEAIGAAPSAGAITIDFGSSQSSCVWSVISVPNAATSSPTAQSKQGSANSATSFASTFAGALEHANNVHLGFAALASNIDIVPDANSAELSDRAPAEAGICRLAAHWARGQITMTPTFALANVAMISVEVKAG